MKLMFHPTMNDVTLPGIFYALSDAARLKILRNLYQSARPLTCMEAVAGVEELPLSTRSLCFRILREAGLIRSEKQGRECYNTLRLQELEAKFPQLLTAILALLQDV